MMGAEIRYLNGHDIRSLASSKDYVRAVRQGFLERGQGGNASPRERIHRSDPGGMLTSYMAILPDTGAMGGYMYSAGFSEKTAYFIVPLFDADTGRLLALLDGASMNPFKTGAAGAVAADELARPDAAVAAVIGSGPQARGQIRCAAEVRDLQLLRVYSPTPDHRNTFADEIDEMLDLEARAVSSAAEAVRGADLIITATTAKNPVFDGSLLEGGEHITAMGQYDRDRREVDTETVRRSTYVPDLRDRVLEDAGAFIQPLEEGEITEDHLHAELGEIVVGNAPGRTSPDEITLFDSGGTGIETTAAAYMLYERGCEQNTGETLTHYSAAETLTGK